MGGEFLGIVEALGGGLSAVVIAMLVAVVARLYARNERLQDRLVDQAQANAEAVARIGGEFRDALRTQETVVRDLADEARDLRRSVDDIRRVGGHHG